eukprot:10545810-Karenia_brevis.AAC.1
MALDMESSKMAMAHNSAKRRKQATHAKKMRAVRHQTIQSLRRKRAIVENWYDVLVRDFIGIAHSTTKARITPHEGLSHGFNFSRYIVDLMTKIRTSTLMGMRIHKNILGMPIRV